jgi:hypothetical protein
MRLAALLFKKRIGLDNPQWTGNGPLADAVVPVPVSSLLYTTMNQGEDGFGDPIQHTGSAVASPYFDYVFTHRSTLDWLAEVSVAKHDDLNNWDDQHTISPTFFLNYTSLEKVVGYSATSTGSIPPGTSAMLNSRSLSSAFFRIKKESDEFTYQPEVDSYFQLKQRRSFDSGVASCAVSYWCVLQKSTISNMIPVL